MSNPDITNLIDVAFQNCGCFACLEHKAKCEKLAAGADLTLEMLRHPSDGVGYHPSEVDQMKKDLIKIRLLKSTGVLK